MEDSNKATFDDILSTIKKQFAAQDPYFLVGVLISLLIVILTIIVLIFRQKSSSRRSVLLVGLSDSGKTTLFSRLIYGEVFPTQTSIQENSSTYVLPIEKKPTITLVDIPGHERVRYKFFEQFKTSARAIIFVIDSLTFHKELKDVAELLYNILTDPVVAQNRLPFLVACNKDDYALAKGPPVIRSALEKELNNVRKTRSASLSTTDGHRSTTHLGRPNHDFSFDDGKPARVDFRKCSAKGGQGDIEDIKDWLKMTAAA